MSSKANIPKRVSHQYIENKKFIKAFSPAGVKVHQRSVTQLGLNSSKFKNPGVVSPIHNKTNGFSSISVDPYRLDQSYSRLQAPKETKTPNLDIRSALSLSQLSLSKGLDATKSSKTLFCPYLRVPPQNPKAQGFIDTGNPYIASPKDMARMQATSPGPPREVHWKSYC